MANIPDPSEWVHISNVTKGAAVTNLSAGHRKSGVADKFQWGDPQFKVPVSDSDRRMFKGLYRHKDYDPHNEAV